jgi:sterol desaturase/sphingolipid hydroxylase (fatty acid hydroxylase superfamily)
VNLAFPTLIIVIVIFVLLFAAEKLFPLRQSRGPLLARLFINAIISGLAFAVAAMVVRPSALRALNWATRQPVGLIHLLPWPRAQFIIGFLLLDLSFYYWHVLNHKAPLLWRFHNVHHIDLDLDVSTGFRFHFGEVLLSTLFRVVQVSLIGISFATFAIYEAVFQANTLFHHSNLRLPIRVERRLNKMFVTDARYSSLSSAARDQFQFWRGVPMVGQAAQDSAIEYFPVNNRNRHSRIHLARRQQSAAHIHHAFHQTA